MPWIWPLNSGDSAMCVPHELVDAIGRVAAGDSDLVAGRCRSVRNENGTGGIVAALLVRSARSRCWRATAGEVFPSSAGPSGSRNDLQRLGQRLRRRLSSSAGRPLFRADVHQPIQEGAGRDDQRCRQL